MTMNFRHWLRNTLLTGLVTLVPIGLTLYVIDFITGTADRLFDILPNAIAPQGIWRFRGAGIIVAFFITLIVGILARNLFGRMIGKSAISIIERIPVIAGLYKLFRQIAQTFLGGGAQGFKGVVLVEWPRRDVWTLAFVTSEVAAPMAHQLGLASEQGPWLNLFVPTTPNPTGGFYFMVPERDVRTTQLSVEAAFKVIISGGALKPD